MAELIQVMIVETGGPDFVCAVSEWLTSGLSLAEFLRHQGVLPDDYEDLSDVANIHLDMKSQAEIDALPEWKG